MCYEQQRFKIEAALLHLRAGDLADSGAFCHRLKLPRHRPDQRIPGLVPGKGRSALTQQNREFLAGEGVTMFQRYAGERWRRHNSLASYETGVITDQAQ